MFKYKFWKDKPLKNQIFNDYIKYKSYQSVHKYTFPKLTWKDSQHWFQYLCLKFSDYCIEGGKNIVEKRYRKRNFASYENEAEKFLQNDEVKLQFCKTFTDYNIIELHDDKKLIELILKTCGNINSKLISDYSGVSAFWGIILYKIKETGIYNFCNNVNNEG
jgi:hypothetical protein